MAFNVNRIISIGSEHRKWCRLTKIKNLNTQETSPYQIFLVYIRSPKTIKEYNHKIDKFFNFLINVLREKEFRTDDREANYLLLYTKAKKWYELVQIQFIQVYIISEK